MTEEQNKSNSKKTANTAEKHFYRASAADFRKIPGSPIAYWVSKRVREAFEKGLPLASIAKPKLGMRTGNNENYIRSWSEVSYGKAGFGFASAQGAQDSHLKWFPYNKGGAFRRWYGNNEYLVNWENDGFEIKEETLRNYPQLSWENLGWKISNERDFFKPCLEWSRISSEYLGVRISTGGFLFDTNGSSAFPEPEHLKFLVAFLCTRISTNLAKIVNPSLAFQPGDLSVLPVMGLDSPSIRELINNLCSQSVSLSKFDWDSFETSWDFTSLPLLSADYHQPTLKATYQKLRAHWWEMTLQMQRLEEENNRIFIVAYGLQDELTPEVPLNEITLTCNPHYRYGGDKSEGELEALLLADTIRELISYAVGCMFGRYSLDIPGLVLANQGDELMDYSLLHNDKLNWGISTSEHADPEDLLNATIERCRFHPDWDNVIPMLDGNWFTDDIAERFRKFLRVAFGEEHYEENLRFVEQALGKNGKARDIRDYFLKDFYSDHVRRYKKRPIYWLFSSPKGSFNALIYMHRYRPDTVSVVLNDYLREFRTKLTSHKNHLEALSISGSASPAEKTKALKEIEKITKMIAEMEEYEREVLYPLATEQVEIDLDDGVKVNYPKFGAALKKIPGLDEKEE